jgi:hypothetical protein
MGFLLRLLKKHWPALILFGLLYAAGSFFQLYFDHALSPHWGWDYHRGTMHLMTHLYFKWKVVTGVLVPTWWTFNTRLGRALFYGLHNRFQVALGSRPQSRDDNFLDRTPWYFWRSPANGGPSW